MEQSGRNRWQRMANGTAAKALTDRDSSLAPGISLTSACACSNGNIGSAVPWMMRVGTLIDESGAEGTSRSDTKPWFSEDAILRARSMSRRTSSRRDAPSRGDRSLPACAHNPSDIR
jgi:hypothetical protein